MLDKPAGLVVHPAPGNLDGTLVNALLAHCGPGFTGIGAERRPGIVHRLDKDTSGVMVVAKTQAANDGADRRLRRARPRPRLSGPVLGRAVAAGRRDRGRHRPRSARPQAHGGGDPRRQAGPDPLPHAARLADRRRAAGMPAGDRAHASNPRAPCRPGPPDRGRSALSAPHSRRRPAAAGADPPDAAGFPAAGAARRTAGLRPPGHRPPAVVRNPAAGRLPGAAEGAGCRPAPAAGAVLPGT